ncbi:hypothetical protein [Deinococcus aquaedulcis]|uniref:hypothetical protein n=1 Tax=Deinococcus aquaedulcis TaxID=2840455 RepID=UPI001C82D8F4|nr:hypothetical protein [Deinococcus aquaedulcis]
MLDQHPHLWRAQALLDEAAQARLARQAARAQPKAPLLRLPLNLRALLHRLSPA